MDVLKNFQVTQNFLKMTLASKKLLKNIRVIYLYHNLKQKFSIIIISLSEKLLVCIQKFPKNYQKKDLGHFKVTQNKD